MGTRPYLVRLVGGGHVFKSLKESLLKAPPALDVAALKI